MTDNDQFIERLENYLDEYEGITPLPDAVRAAIRAELPKTKQIGPLAGLSRFLSMTMHIPTTARYGLAAAAVVAAVLIGASFLGGGSIGGPSGSPSQQTSASQSPSVAPTDAGPISLVEAPLPDDLAAGEYYLDLPVYPARIDFTLPGGWWHFYDQQQRADSAVHAVLVQSEDTGANNGSAWGLSFTVVDEVRVDPCDPSAGTMDQAVTDSVDSLVEAFSSWQEFPATNVMDVSIGGYDGRQLEITRAEGVDCDAVLFWTPSNYLFGPQFPSSEPAVNQFTFLDVDGSVLAIWTTDFPATTQFEVDGGASPDPEAHVADQAQLRDILDSVVITPR